ncbi:MAG: sulfatase-like hydrolase/transferase [Erysipelotrichales bacterium]|nr:sulfatase-like hydrolase/transferase [Erysipelotrichales bacterium]
MKKVIKRDFVYNMLVLVISLFSIEILNKIISGSSLIDFSIIRILLGIVFISIIISSLFSLGKRLISKIGIPILVFAFCFYSFLQAGFHNFLGVYISFQTSSQLGAVKSYIKDFFASFKPLYFIVFIPFFLLLIYYIFIDKKIDVIAKSIKNKLHIIVTLITLVFIGLLYYISIVIPLFQNSFQSVSNKELFLTASNPSVTIDQFGELGFCFLDIKAMLFPVVIKEEYIVNHDNKHKVNENSRVFDDEAWEMLIENETNEDLNYINKYLINRKATDKNSYTGMFEGKNLIIIMMESANDILIDPDYYPNFYKMLSNGWYFENNYSPRNSCATMNNEFSGMTSLYSIYNTCTASKYKSNSYFESVFNLFNKQDNYITFSAHNYTQAYYPRKKIHTNMGSGEYYGVEKLGIKYSNEYRNWSNDDDFMKSVLKIIDKKTSNGQNFMTWLTTVSSHQPYSYASIQGDKYYSMTKGEKYPTDVRRYMSKLKILDNGLGVLLEGLEKRGILDDTVIVMYGDHYPYGISTKNLNKVLDYNTSKDMNAERVPLVIYNPTVESQAFSQYTSYMDILPTLANLFNLDYDPRLYLGTDLFSKDHESLTVFADGSWKNENAYYNASKVKIKYYSSFEYRDEEIKAINDDIEEKIKVSSKIIKNNYFKYLEKKLVEYEELVRQKYETICSLDEIEVETLEDITCSLEDLKLT